MNWDQIAGKWKQVSGKVKEKWGKLTDSDLDVISGRRDQLVGIIQERYGVMKDEALKQVDDFARTLNLGTETNELGEHEGRERAKARRAGTRNR